MGQSVYICDKLLTQGTAGSGGGTYVMTVDTTASPFIDKITRFWVQVYFSHAVASHLNDASALLAECVVVSKTSTVTFLTAVATSSNPINSNTAGFIITSRVEAEDTTMNLNTVVLTIGANKLVITCTNNAGSGSVAANVTVVVDYECVGST